MAALGEHDAFGILRTVEQLAAFNATAKALLATSDMQSVFEVVEGTVPALVGDCSWAVLLRDADTGRLKVEAGSPDVRQEHETPTLLLRESTDGYETSTITEQSCFYRLFGPAPRGVLAIPLQVRDTLVGVLELACSAAEPQLTEERRQAAVAIADLVALAIGNATTLQRLAALSIHDEHTGLFNARHLKAELARELKRMKRFRRPLSLLFFDLDHFKKVNDTHGHLVGSAVLREVGEVVRGAIRSCDSAYRYGGDEFAVLLLETDALAAEIVARRVHERLRRHHFSGGKELDLKVTASVGVTTAAIDEEVGEELVRRADRAMYAVKAAGRDNVASFESLP